MMNALRAAAGRGDTAATKEISDQMAEAGLGAQDLVEVVRLALKGGALMTAHDLATRGVALYPANVEVGKLAALLVPSKARLLDAPPDPSIEINHRWLSTHRASYRGQWVALRAGALLAEGASCDEVLAQIDPTTGILVTVVR